MCAEAFYNNFMYLYNKNILEYGQIARNGTESMIPDTEGRSRNSIFLVEFSGNIGRNGFLTSIASQKIFRPYFQKSRLEYYFLCLFYFSSPYSGHLGSDFVVLLLLFTARSRRTRNVQKSKRDMKNMHFMADSLIQNGRPTKNGFYFVKENRYLAAPVGEINSFLLCSVSLLA